MVNGKENEKYFGMTKAQYEELDPEVKVELKVLKAKTDRQLPTVNSILGLLANESLQGAVDIMKIVNQDITQRVQNMMNAEKVKDWK